MNRAYMFAAGILIAALPAFAQTCNNPQGTYALDASLAIAMSMDLDRLDALVDLEVSGDRMALSDEGRARCQSLGNCRHIDAILGLQDESVYEYIDRTVFDPVIFRQRLVIQWQRQYIAAGRPEHDLTRAWVAPHSLGFLGSIVLPNTCGTHYEFAVTALDSVPVTPLQICTQLIFAGSQGVMSGDQCVSENPFLNVRYSYPSGGLHVWIDPTVELVNHTDAALTGNEMIASCYYVDAMQSAEGIDCECSGIPGHLQAAVLNSPIYLCK